MAVFRVIALAGSLRKASISRGLAEAAVRVAPPGIEVDIFDLLGEVPYYNEDLDAPGPVPAEVITLRSAIIAADAALIITPEYNGSLPGVLKNAIDWASRPHGRGALSGKETAIIGLSTGGRGGARALEELRIIVGIAGGVVVEGACLSVGRAGHLFGTPRTATDDEVETKIAQSLQALADLAGPDISR
ncbi:NAD(P)H-dependent oxidoreductase [Nocardia sp. NPDC006630]|uniref:NAD(P)H-dependent oxidoreductase n=1 Tax=Nocardia sp. NPDC006630 TaxID=3157181 RepID=UPI0033B14922